MRLSDQQTGYRNCRHFFDRYRDDHEDNFGIPDIGIRKVRSLEIIKLAIINTKNAKIIFQLYVSA